MSYVFGSCDTPTAGAVSQHSWTLTWRWWDVKGLSSVDNRRSPYNCSQNMKLKDEESFFFMQAEKQHGTFSGCFETFCLLFSSISQNHETPSQCRHYCFHAAGHTSHSPCPQLWTGSRSQKGGQRQLSLQFVLIISVDTQTVAFPSTLQKENAVNIVSLHFCVRFVFSFSH